MVIADLEPLVLPVLVRVDVIILEVLLMHSFPHLDARSTYYVQEVAVRLRLHSEELLEQCPVGPDPQKGLTEVNEDRDVEDSIGVQMDMLDLVIIEQSIKSYASYKTYRITHFAARTCLNYVPRVSPSSS